MLSGEMYAACVDALRDFVRAAGFREAVIGLSGGIDSAVTATMAVDALGAENVHGVLLPGPYSSRHSVQDAEELANNLGVSHFTVSINEPYAAFERALGAACNGGLRGLAAENTQARCRMVCLMALSNAHGWLLLNTGNKSEALMGYSTLYGDTAGAFAPIGGLYKTDVYAVGRWRNEQAEQAGCVPPIPERIFTKPPSAELAPGQSDERSMGVTYAEIDELFKAHRERGESVEAAAEHAGMTPAAAEAVLARVTSYAFKRAQEPPYPQTAFYAE